MTPTTLLCCTSLKTNNPHQHLLIHLLYTAVFLDDVVSEWSLLWTL